MMTLPDIHLIILNSLLIIGIYASTWDGMIFENQRVFLDSKLPWYIRKPLYECVICMASIWGCCFYFSVVGFKLDVIPHIVCLAGLNTIVSGIIYLAYERNANS